MKKFYLLGALAMGMAFASCSNEEEFVGPEKPTFADGTAYLKVNIADANATRGIDAGFEYGSADEHKVTSADFYFYDANGAYVTKANVWAGGDDNLNRPTQSIEYFGKNIVVLKGVTQNTFPKYVVTVLNQPAGFEPAENLKEMEAVLVNTINRVDGDKVSNFVMTTTSYFDVNESGNLVDGSIGSGDNKQPVYFATEVSSDNFVDNPGALDETKVLDIYVERLAAKIRVDVDESVLVPVAGQAHTYEMQVTVAGGDNTAEDGSNIGAEKIRVKFDGWGLNATAKESHVVKNISSAWTNELLGFDWNDNDNYRSYWGTSTVYDLAYPTDADGQDVKNYKDQLNYNTLAKMTVAFGANAYCAENTNTADKLQDNLSRVATSVLVNATVLFPVYGEDGTVTGWAAQDLVRVNGVLFKEAEYIKYVLNNLKTLGLLNYYKKTTEGKNTVYTQLSEADVIIKNNGAGMVQLTLAGTDEWYAKNGEDYTESPVETTALENAFADRQGNAYKGGKMFYTIPIQHQNNPEKPNVKEPKEGEYGVVRNHYYKLTINSLNNLGKGVYDPDSEEIIPDPNDENNYQVGVKINILSWKVVDQTVGL